MKRETLNSRLGFLLLTAGCAIGLGNVWRFPFVVGENGGAQTAAVALNMRYLVAVLFLISAVLEFVGLEQIQLTPGKKVDFVIHTNRGPINKSVILPPESRYLHIGK